MPSANLKRYIRKLPPLFQPYQNVITQGTNTVAATPSSHVTYNHNTLLPEFNSVNYIRRSCLLEAKVTFTIPKGSTTENISVQLNGFTTGAVAIPMTPLTMLSQVNPTVLTFKMPFDYNRILNTVTANPVLRLDFYNAAPTPSSVRIDYVVDCIWALAPDQALP
jgi:hypothetical protein